MSVIDLSSRQESRKSSKLSCFRSFEMTSRGDLDNYGSATSLWLRIYRRPSTIKILPCYRLSFIDCTSRSKPPLLYAAIQRPLIPWPLAKNELFDAMHERSELGHERIERQILVFLLCRQVSQATPKTIGQFISCQSTRAGGKTNRTATHPARISFLLIGPSLTGLLLEPPAAGAENRSST